MTRLGTPLFSMTITALAMCGAAAFADTGIKVGDSAMGPVLTDANGMTLYTFAKDVKGSGASACYDACAANWPPLGVAASARPLGDYSIIIRQDGTRQWAYKGMPLYYFAKDAKPGDKMGNGLLGGAWKVATP